LLPTLKKFCRFLGSRIPNRRPSADALLFSRPGRQTSRRFPPLIISAIRSHLSTSGLFAVWRLNSYSWDLRSRFRLSRYFLNRLCVFSSSSSSSLFSLPSLESTCSEALYSGALHNYTQRVSPERPTCFPGKSYLKSSGFLDPL